MKNKNSLLPSFFLKHQSHLMKFDQMEPLQSQDILEWYA